MAYATPTTRAAGYVVPYTVWNSDVVDNVIALRTGAIAIASQAAGDVVYAASATQLARLAAGTTSQVLIGGASAPAWSNTPTLTGTNITGIPAASILSGTFGSGNYVVTGTLAWGGGSAISSSSNVALLDAVNSFTAAGTHTWSAAGSNEHLLQTTGTTTYMSYRGEAGSTAFQIAALAQSYGSSGIYQAGHAVFDAQTAGGLTLAASHASGDLRLYSRGALAATFGASQAATFTGDVSLASGLLTVNGGASITGGSANFFGDTGVSKTGGSDTIGNYLLKSTGDGANYAALKLGFTGNASAASRVFSMQTIEQGVANAGILQFQPFGGTVLFSGDVSLASTIKLYFDGGGDTYTYESAANTLDTVVQGTRVTRLTNAGMWLATTDTPSTYPTAATAPLSIYTDKITSSAGTAHHIRLLLMDDDSAPLNAAISGNPIADHFVSIHAYLNSSDRDVSASAGIWGYNGVLHAMSGDNVHLNGIEIDLQNESGETWDAAVSGDLYVTTGLNHPWAQYSKQGVSVAIGPGGGNLTAAFVMGAGDASYTAHTGDMTKSQFEYGFYGLFAKYMFHCSRQQSTFAAGGYYYDPVTCFDNVTNATNFIKTTGSHTNTFVSPAFNILTVGPKVSLDGIENTLVFNDTDASSNEKFYRFINSAGTFSLDLLNDAYDTATNIFNMTRSGTSMGTFTFNPVLSFANSVYIAPLASVSGTRYICIDTAGLLSSSASACSGTDAEMIAAIPSLLDEMAQLRQQVAELSQRPR